MIVYYRLFDKLRRKGISKGDFCRLSNIAPATMARLSCNKSVSMATIDKICLTLNCNIGDIMEYIPDNVETRE